MKSILILHFRPPKLYPPLLNFISILDERKIPYKLITAEKYNYKNAIVVRLFNVLKFFLIGNTHALYQKGPIICIESISTIGLFASNFLIRKQKVYFHYHEYFSNDEYKRESFLERLGHKFERIILKRALLLQLLFIFKLKLLVSCNFNIINFPSRSSCC